MLELPKKFFQLNLIIKDVDRTLRECFSYYHRDDFDGLIDQASFRNRSKGVMNSRFIDGLCTNLLFAAMDYLNIVQSLPEQRKMMLSTEEGALPIIM